MSRITRVLCVLLTLLLAATAFPSARRVSRAAPLDASLRSAAGFIESNPVSPRDVAVLAHRGASGERRENTLEAFRYAAGLGADAVELDVRATADGQLAVIHNARVRAGLRGLRRVSELTLAQLQVLRPFVPTLEDALACIAETDMQVMIELKTAGIEQRVLECVESSGMRDRAFFASFSTEVLQAIRALRPDAHTICLVREKAILNSLMRAPEQQKCEIIAVKYTLLNAMKVRSLHQNGIQVIAWTVNHVPDIRLILAMDVDGVITDYPDRLRD